THFEFVDRIAAARRGSATTSGGSGRTTRGRLRQNGFVTPEADFAGFADFADLVDFFERVVRVRARAISTPPLSACRTACAEPWCECAENTQALQGAGR